MGDLLIVTGPPGAGKPTVAKLLATGRLPSALVAGDDFFAMVRAGSLAPWLPEAHAQNGVLTSAAPQPPAVSWKAACTTCTTASSGWAPRAACED